MRFSEEREREMSCQYVIGSNRGTRIEGVCPCDQDRLFVDEDLVISPPVFFLRFRGLGILRAE